ncbi:hypothetical protein EIN_118040 [Entamoeba invadens IP1]|uniref:SP-RING-type domain-containing protein n=1 Tax=Entamoeba invadens IP1 TaxID=370355 RepID=L7FPW1_ENTIV|nr:hypothetical protein EIN_118040 [Entamoeba invadens IP1]ELP92230.1 hypothetical protein EIN_118040 [Entamoeba invadens IP1]|eukprot:XP_004259001.1 hypothetical protein EIN_118040 [Entamoeba invadens IP1]
MNTVLAQFKLCESLLTEFKITTANAPMFFSETGGIAHLTLPQIEKIADIISNTFPDLRLRKRRNTKKKAYIKYIVELVTAPIGSLGELNPSVFQTSVATQHKTQQLSRSQEEELSITNAKKEAEKMELEKINKIRPLPKNFGSNSASQNVAQSPLQSTQNISSQSFGSSRRSQQNLLDYSFKLSNDIYKSIYNTFTGFNKFTPNVKSACCQDDSASNTSYTYNTDVQQNLLNVEFFRTQHPQYYIDKILYCKPFLSPLNKARTEINIGNKKNNQRITVRVFDTKTNTESADIYIIQLIANSNFVDLDGLMQPLYGQPHSTPAVVRKPLDITTNCYSSVNSLSVMVNKYSSDVVLVISLCSYRQIDELLTIVESGLNLNEPDNQYKALCDFQSVIKVIETKRAVFPTDCINIDDDDDLNEGLSNTNVVKGSTQTFFPMEEVPAPPNSVLKQEEKSVKCEDVSVGKTQINLRCPLSFQMIQIPVRGCECKHTTVVNLKGMLDYCLNNCYWNCPICEKPCYFSMITIDQHLKTLIQLCPSDCCLIELDANGTVLKYINDLGDSCGDDDDVEVIVD